MKRTEITAGRYYAVSPSPDWSTGTHWRGAPECWLVLDTGKWHEPDGWGYKKTEPENRTFAGLTVRVIARTAYASEQAGVLAIKVNGTTGEPIVNTYDKGAPRAVALSLNHIRAEWDEGIAKYRANHAAYVERTTKAKEASEALDERVANAIAALKAALVKSDPDLNTSGVHRDYHNHGNVGMPVALVERIAAALGSL